MKSHMDSLFIASCIIVIRDAVFSVMLQRICYMTVIKVTKPVIDNIIAYLQVWLYYTSLYSSPGYRSKWARCVRTHVPVSSNGGS
jgi:hypothetical protein